MECQAVGQDITFCFPLQDADPLGKPRQPSKTAHLCLRNIKTLVVEDDKDARELARFVLEQQGAKVESAENAREALLILNLFQPNVLISNIGMPNADGYAFLKTVRALPNLQLRSTPAIALTAYAREEDCQYALSVGFQAHLTKPLRPSEIVATV